MAARVHFKDGVIWAMPHHAIVEAVGVLAELHEEMFGTPMTITSAREGRHSTHSKHYTGEAVDIRSRHMPVPDIIQFIREARAKLGNSYDIVREPTHIHVEYDPKPQ